MKSRKPAYSFQKVNLFGLKIHAKTIINFTKIQKYCFVKFGGEYSQITNHHEKSGKKDTPSVSLLTRGSRKLSPLASGNPRRVCVSRAIFLHVRRTCSLTLTSPPLLHEGVKKSADPSRPIRQKRQTAFPPPADWLLASGRLESPSVPLAHLRLEALPHTEQKICLISSRKTPLSSHYLNRENPTLKYS